MRICVLGSAGSGTTTIAKLIAKHYGYNHLESDYFSWLQTDPPFQKNREDNESIEMLDNAINKNENIVIGGNVAKWGKHFCNSFDLVIFLYAPTQIRLERIQKRDSKLYGKRILQNGDMYKNYETFLNYASAYDIGDESFRSRTLHETFLKSVNCDVVRVNTNANLITIMKNIYNKIEAHKNEIKD